MEDQSINFCKEALAYLQLGWVPFPLGKNDKKPLIEWKPYQQRKPSINEVKSWWERWPNANIGIVTGKISGIVVFDADGPEVIKFLKEQGGFPRTPASKTGKGFHLVFAYPDFDVGNLANKKLLLDVRGDGGYIVAPPSIHPSGCQYQWVKEHSPFDLEPAPLEDWMVDYLKKNLTDAAGEIKISSCRENWEKAITLISSKPKIIRHWMTPKPEDRSGHDWRLCCLSIEEGIHDPATLYQIVLNNPHGKAKGYPETDRYIKDLITRCLTKLGAKAVEDNGFPRAAIKGDAKEFADLYSAHLESPWSFFVSCFFTVLGCLFSDCTLEAQTRPQPRLYTFLLGESADDRKSEAIKQTINFFSEIKSDVLSPLSEFRPLRGVGSAEGLAEWMVEHPKTLLVLDEAKSFVSKAKVEGSVLLPAVASLFDSNSYENRTKGHAIKIDSGCLSILAGSTSETYSRMWSPSFLDIGFINRLWLVPDRAERRIAIPGLIPEEEKKKLQDRIKSKLEASLGIAPEVGNIFGDLFNFEDDRSRPQERPTKLPTSFKITPEANEIYSKWYGSLQRSIFTKRLDSYALRFMLLFSIGEGESQVTADIAERVVTLLEWQHRVREEHDPIDAEGILARVEQAIRRALSGGPLGQRALQHKIHYERTGLSAWKTAIHNLLEAKEIVFDHRTRVYSRAEENV